MGLDADIIVNEEIHEPKNSSTGSTVTIAGIKSVKFPEKGLDVIARVLVERILPYFIDPNFECPQINVTDSADGRSRCLNDYLSSSDRQIIELTSKPAPFMIKTDYVEEHFEARVFNLYAAKAAKSKISLVAHRREVNEVSLQSNIPEFAGEFYDKVETGTTERDRNYIIKAYVLGPYLDKHVSLERGGFNFSREGDLLYGISQSQIEGEAAKIAQEAVGSEISERKERKVARIKSYVETNAPWHRRLSEKADFSGLPMDPSDEQIEIHLQTDKFKIEQKARAAVREILASPEPSVMAMKTSKAVELISETNKNDLAHYVALRKCVLDLFAKALEKDPDGKFKSEGTVHDIIIPRKADSDELDYEQHNLWMLDERLNFAAYASSDKPIDKGRSDRTDITVFNHPVAFRGENEPSNPVTIFEFKKPQRDDFVNASSAEDPVEQVKRYVNQIRENKVSLPNGRTIRVSSSTPFYGYVVCDLTPKVKEWLFSVKDFTEMTDGLGWFKWISNIRLYIEVLSWEKVLADAEMRNKIFFHKLGI